MPQVEELENLNIPKEKEVKEEIITADPQEPEEETSNEAIQNSDGSVEDDSGEAESIEMDSQNGDKSEDQPLIQNQPWSHTLSSPVGMEGCSPSLDFSRAESLHGIGFRLALKKSRSIGFVGHRLLLFLNEIVAVYETFGVVCLKCSQFMQPKLFPSLLSEESNEFNDAVNAFTLHFRKLAVFYKTQIVDPLEESLTKNGVVVNNANQRYLKNRQVCKDARQKVFVARRSYSWAVKNAEIAFETWKKARETTPVPLLKTTLENDKPSEDTEDWEKALMRFGAHVLGATVQLVQQLKIVQTSEAEYRELVSTENECVTDAHEVESLGIEEVQKVIQGRLDFFLNSVVAEICNTDKETIDRMKLTPVDPALLKKQRDGLFATLFKQQNLRYEPGTSLMDAEILGLSLRLGRLREDIRATFSAHSDRMKVIEALKGFVENFIDGNYKLSLSLKIWASGKGNPTQIETLQEFALNNLGPKSAKLFENTLQMFDDEAESTKQLIELLRNLSNEKLNPLLDTCEQKLQAHIMADEAEWKQLCDASRFCSRAETRYNLIKNTFEKNRERLPSVDTTKSTKSDDDAVAIRNTKSESDAEENSNTAAQNTPNRLYRFNMLPGKEVMKRLREDALNTISKITINEEREEKEKKALEIARAAKDRAIQAYKSLTEDRFKELETEDNEGWEDIKRILDSIANGMSQFVKSGKEAREKPISPENEITFDMMNTDIGAWLEECKKTIDDSTAQDGDAAKEVGYLQMLKALSEHDRPYKLDVSLEESDSVYKLLELNGDETSIPELEIHCLEAEVSESVNAEEENEVELNEEDSTEKIANDTKVGEGTENIDDAEEPVKTTLEAPVESTEDEVRPHQKSNLLDDNDRAQDAVMPNGDQQLQLFKKHFLSEKEEQPPQIFQSISCFYRTKNVLVAPVRGCLYTTTDKIYFLAIDGKNFTLRWKDVVGIDIERGLRGGINNNGLTVTYISKSLGETLFILGKLDSRESTLKHLLELLEAHKKKESVEGVTNTTETPQNGALSPLPPDHVIGKMETVLSRTMKNVSIPRVYDHVWSEGNKTSEAPFYGPWLEKEDCFNVKIEDWEYAAANSEGFVNPWDHERYSQRRLVSFKFKRMTHLYIGPPVAIVKQQQYCRIEGKNKCIVAMCVTFEGMPYGDTFAVEVRWIATRQGQRNVLIEVGLFVDFRKNTIMRSQIKAGTISETKNVHNRLFEAVRNACSASREAFEEDIEPYDEGKKEVQKKDRALGVVAKLQDILFNLPLDTKILFFATGFVMLNIFSFACGSKQSQSSISANDFQNLVGRIDELEGEVRTLHKSFAAMTTLLEKQS